MHKLNSSIFAAIAAILLAVLAVTPIPLMAQSDQGLAARQFGKGLPKNISDLPPGQLKRKLETLPPQASAKALKWLQDIEFTGTDLDVLKVDDAGGVFFADPLLPQPSGALGGPEPTLPEDAPAETLANVFKLHSRPGAANVVYIDFNGHVFSGTAWGSGATLSGVAYDLDGNPAIFSDTERRKIVDIWHRVAEDLAPFNIDVTTEEPTTFTRYTGRILVTKDVDANGVDMPSKGAGGVAYVGVFGNSNYHTYYSPALVYYNNLGGGVETYVAECASHEFGHNLGLSHDGTTSGTTYYAGHGSGLVSWAPIMGNSYYNNVTEWSKGEYTGANQTQDDLAIIQGRLGLVADDHANAIGSGSPLLVDASGAVLSSNPELDPDNLLPENKGVINSSTDVDVFSFAAGSGSVALTVRPAWDAFYRATSRRGANLDIKLELRNSAGSLVTTATSASDTAATLNATVGAGTYHLLVTGEGNGTGTSGYTQYASLGQYFINGSLTAGTADTQPPSPNPMGWISAPAATSESAISMTALVATDDTSTVQYNFQCLAGGSGCVNSGWKSSNSHTLSGLAANTSYTFNVLARDQAGNVTSTSANASATTLAPPPPPPLPESSGTVASGETARTGTVTGTFSLTHANDGAAQRIMEKESGGKADKRYSYLEHRWTFSLPTSQAYVVHANAWSGGSADGDVFRFEYSTDGGRRWNLMFTVSSTSNSNEQTFALPGTQSGTLLVRVIDSNHVAGQLSLDSIYIDHLYLD
jgi:hypothetical protein